MKPMTVAWGGTSKLTCGYTNGERTAGFFHLSDYLYSRLGQVINYDIRRALETEMEEADAIPQKYVLNAAFAHESCVRCMAWLGLVDPVNYATSGNDGRIQVFDYRDPYVPMLLLRNRSKGRYRETDTYLY